VWEILALRHGTRDRPARVNVLNAPDPHDLPMPSPCWTQEFDAPAPAEEEWFATDVVCAHIRDEAVA
jgi:hypothetical protein